MFSKERYNNAVKALNAFKKAPYTCTNLTLSEKEALRLERQFRYRKLVFGYSDNQVMREPRTYVIFKT